MFSLFVGDASSSGLDCNLQAVPSHHILAHDRDYIESLQDSGGTTYVIILLRL